MRWISTDMKFAYVDSKHNIFHWLIVVFIRIIYALVLIPLSFYSGAIGFMFSAETIQSFLRPVWFEKINFYSAQLPYFPFIKESIFNQLGDWYLGAPTWWTMVVGLPLMVMAISIFLINLFNLYYSIFSRTYNRTHCHLCKEPIKTEIS